MRFRTALNKYKRDRGKRFSEGCRASDGAFPGRGDRLVYVGFDGSLRNYSASLSGLYGTNRSWFGIETDGEAHWFDELGSVRQHYYRETNLVEAEYDVEEYTIHRYDLTLGRIHVTHVGLRDAILVDAHPIAFFTLAPKGRETRIGRLIHEADGLNDTQAVEAFRRDEHDHITASTGLTDVRGQVPKRLDKILSDDTFDFPRETVLDRYEDTHLSDDVVVSAPLEQGGHAAWTALVTQLLDRNEVARTDAPADL